MAVKKPALKVVEPDLAQMEAVVLEAAKQAAPMVQRLATHRLDLGPGCRKRVRSAGDQSNAGPIPGETADDRPADSGGGPGDDDDGRPAGFCAHTT